jgi:hypothetical protein
LPGPSTNDGANIANGAPLVNHRPGTAAPTDRQGSTAPNY